MIRGMWVPMGPNEPIGPNGLNGPYGPNGPNRPNELNGHNGPNGPNGPNGAKGPCNVFLCILAKLCKYVVSSQFDYHSESRLEILCYEPGSK